MHAIKGVRICTGEAVEAEVTSDRPTVPAAPNRCSIRAEVVNIRPDIHFPDKWILDIMVLESRHISGPNFAHPGDRSEAFAFGEMPVASAGDVITAEAEFVGDERGGKFRLSRMSSA